MSFTLITGASAGIGEATAHLLAEQKRNLILVARRKEKLEALKAALEQTGIEVKIFAADLTDAKEIDAVFKAIGQDDIDAVINNAGAAFGRDALETASMEDLEGMIDLDITAFLRVTKLSIPLLKKTSGHLVHLGSIAGLQVYEGGLTYCGTKHFVHAVTKGLRSELLGSGIRITEIAPGAVDTEFSEVRFKGDAARAKKVYEGYEPLHARDVADAIWYALSRPKHVNIEHLLIMPTAQANGKTYTGK